MEPRPERVALDAAREAGFELVGTAPLEPPPAAQRLAQWIERGRHAGMDWLARDASRRMDPRRVLPEGRSILVVGLPHGRPPVSLSDGARVARYAAGRDYHNVLGKALKRLSKRLKELGAVRQAKPVVDAGPLMERSHAARAGLGFESKSANLLHHRHGPWFFLGELLLDSEPEGEASPAPGSCGTCRACLDACPTGALVEPGVLDANLCISYHTIENRGHVPHALRPALGPWLFGCDVCSEVCPFGQRATGGEARLGTHPALPGTGLVDLVEQRGDPARWNGSPLARAGARGLARNAALVLGNLPSEEGRGALLRALEDPLPTVREAAAWSLARAHGASGSADAGVPAALDRAEARADDDERRALREAREAARAAPRPPEPGARPL